MMYLQILWIGVKSNLSKALQTCKLDSMSLFKQADVNYPVRQTVMKLLTVSIH